MGIKGKAVEDRAAAIEWVTPVIASASNVDTPNQKNRESPVSN